MRTTASLLVCAVILTAAAPAVADWLVTRDGTTIETDGEWEVRGPLVVFKQADGKLASIRLSELDLEASEARSAQRSTAQTTAQTGNRVAPARDSSPVRVFTDADFAHARPRGSGTGEVAETQAEAAETPAPPASELRVEVAGWQDELNVEAGALEVSGSVVNRGASVATNTLLEVLLLDGAGRVVERRSATVSNPVLGPNASSPFMASFPGSPAYSSIEFDLRSRGFRTRAPAPDGGHDTDQ